MSNIIFKNISKDDNFAVADVIGVILLIGITVSIAATVLFYVSGQMDEGIESTPSVSMKAEVLEDKSEVVITILKISDLGISWNDVSGSLINISSGTSELNGTGWKLVNDDISGGDVINLRIADIFGDFFTEGDEYRFTLYYDRTNSIMGTVTWIHQ